jgi:hypothetical protein
MVEVRRAETEWFLRTESEFTRERRLTREFRWQDITKDNVKLSLSSSPSPPLFGTAQTGKQKNQTARNKKEKDCPGYLPYTLSLPRSLQSSA